MYLKSTRIFAPANSVTVASSGWLEEMFPEVSLIPCSSPEPWFGLHGDDSYRSQELDFLNQIFPNTLYLAGRGGYGTARALKHFLRNGQPQPPRSPCHAICGFSDVTVLLNVLPFYGFNVWHGPHATYPRRFVMNGLMQKSLEALIHNQPYTKALPCLKDFPMMQGRFIGGNLTVFLSLAGTSFMPSFDQKILVLEDIGESTYRLDRMFQQLLILNELKQLKAIVLGQFTQCPVQDGDGFCASLAEVIADFIKRCPVPVIQDFPLGHIEDMLVLPMDRLIQISDGRISWDARPERNS